MSPFKDIRSDEEIITKAKVILDFALKLTGKPLDPDFLKQIIEKIQQENYEKFLRTILMDYSHEDLERVLNASNERIRQPIRIPEPTNETPRASDRAEEPTGQKPEGIKPVRRESKVSKGVR